MSRKIVCTIGTRPEAIKMVPVILALKNEPWAEVRVLATAQHRDMLDQMLDFFGIESDIDLDIMRPDQTLPVLTSRLLPALDDVLDAEKPDVVLAQGDTTTVMTMALACFYRHIPFGHVEAGLRTGDIQNPFPEEANRTITSQLAQWHFAPTENSRQNLLREGISDSDIIVTGNTVIDTLIMTSVKEFELEIDLNPEHRIVLITVHRRENFGQPFVEICQALHILADRNLNVQFLYPVHPNPNIKNVAHEMLGACANIHLLTPLDYISFVTAMKKSYMIISDSGGIQEEAPALGKPVLVLRNKTERPEAVAAGVVKLVGSNRDRIVRETQRLLDDETAYQEMARNVSPYGDGQSAGRIVETVKLYFRQCA